MTENEIRQQAARDRGANLNRYRNGTIAEATYHAEDAQIIRDMEAQIRRVKSLASYANQW
jgi:hypothetical protein